MRETIKRGCTSFAISALAGAAVNLAIDIIGNAAGIPDFSSLSPEFARMFPTQAMAVYVNILLYGVIGAVFAMAASVFEISRIGFVLQGILYFAVTSVVCVGITVLLWQLHHYPQALLSTFAGYGMTYAIMGTIAYRRLREDVREINTDLS